MSMDDQIDDRPIRATSSDEVTSGVPSIESRAIASASCLRNILNGFARLETSARQPHRRLPPISASRLADARSHRDGSDTKLYLAYGSNLCHETFQGRRGIRPLGQVNVVAPTLRMTFDLPGIPYNEPCFANSATRDANNLSRESVSMSGGYNKDKWKKGMVGVVYEVTPEDYTHIIATEGGGASYKDVLVPCFLLAPGVDDVPEAPESDGFLAHTLFAPAVPPDDPEHHDGRFSRPDPSYAQPSARYLKLITDGAEEHSLPREYKDYLYSIRPYEARSQRTKMGAFVFEMLWMPFLVFFISLSTQYRDKDGNVPHWVARLGAMIFGAVWTSYDGIFKPIFGDGERTDYSQPKSEAGRWRRTRVQSKEDEEWAEK